MLASAALVMFMTPGLAFFYGGLVRAKNVLGTVMQSFVALGLVTVLWGRGGYTLPFGPAPGGGGREAPGRRGLGGGSAHRAVGVAGGRDPGVRLVRLQRGERPCRECPRLGRIRQHATRRGRGHAGLDDRRAPPRRPGHDR